MPKGVYDRPPRSFDELNAEFGSRIQKTETCWLWTGAKISTGYGTIGWHGRTLLAHRVAFILGRLGNPFGLFVCHHCDVKLCVRPDHLFLGTNSDNLQDSISKGRFVRANSKKRQCKRGHPFDEANTRLYRGHRVCRICSNEKGRSWRLAHPEYFKKPGLDDEDDE